MTTYKIPDAFWIGTSSSAWQIEGNSDKPHAGWADLFYESDPKRWNKSGSLQQASDFIHHYHEDIKAMAAIGMNTFRISIQWARFMQDPLDGIVNQQALDYYRDVINEIKANGMQPFVSLEHWDIPAVLFEVGDGWVSRDTIDYYLKYVEAVFANLSDIVEYFFTFTEPNVPIDNGYMDGIWYPFRKDAKAAYQAHFHKTLANALAVKAFKPYRELNHGKLGIMLHYTPVYSRGLITEDDEAADIARQLHVNLYLDPCLKGIYNTKLLYLLNVNNVMFDYQPNDLTIIKQYRIDLIGFDYYFPIRVKKREQAFEGGFHPQKYYEEYRKEDREFNADRGWEIYPQAIADLGQIMKEEYDNFNWFISENGIGIANEERYRNQQGMIVDTYRIDFLKRHLQMALKAKAKGSNCLGYLVWSFVDNCSAINAFKNRYGLMELDLNHQERHYKASALWFKEINQNKGI